MCVAFSRHAAKRRAGHLCRGTLLPARRRRQPRQPRSTGRRWRRFASAAVRLRVHCVVPPPRRRCCCVRAGVLRSCRRAPLTPLRRLVMDRARVCRGGAAATEATDGWRACPCNDRRRRRPQNRLQRRPATTAVAAATRCIGFSFSLSPPPPRGHRRYGRRTYNNVKRHARPTRPRGYAAVGFLSIAERVLSSCRGQRKNYARKSADMLSLAHRGTCRTQNNKFSSAPEAYLGCLIYGGGCAHFF